MAALYKEGYDAYSGKKYDDAVSALSKVVEMDETYENGNALYYLAQAYRKNEDMENAKIYYQKVVELYPIQSALQTHRTIWIRVRQTPPVNKKTN